MRFLILTQKIDREDPILGFFHDWVREFALHTENVEVISLEKGVYDLPKNVTVHSLGKENRTSKLSQIITFYRYIFSLRRNYDVVFVHMNPEYLVLGGWFWKLCKKRTLLWYTHKSKNLWLRIGMKFSDRIFTASPESFPLRDRKVVVLGHGINPARYEEVVPREIDTLHLMSVGRISRSKGIDLMLLVVEALRAKHVRVQLSLIGGPITLDDEKYEQSLRQTVRDKKMPVQFLGPLPPSEIPKHLARADIFINLSETGGLDKAVLEAMAMGLPVVTTNYAFKSTLGGSLSVCFIPSREVASIVSGIEVLNGKTLEERVALGRMLREVIVAEHNLSQLISRIVSLV